MDSERIKAAFSAVRERLLSLRGQEGWWEGELSSSALSTAIAASAFSVIERDRHSDKIAAAVKWLAADSNPDGGWGDTPESPSNLPTTMLVRAAFRLGGVEEKFSGVIRNADDYIARLAGSTQAEQAEALKALYAPDYTFVVPILCNLALADLAEWKSIPALPFELAVLPQALLRCVRLDVVSYALPALIAVGQLLHLRGRRGSVFMRPIRSMLISSTLRKLEAIQPDSGGFLEAIPLTGFVLMSLAGTGRRDHVVVSRGVDFLSAAMRPDGSWPIDRDLSVWVTTQAVSALWKYPLPPAPDGADSLRKWIVRRQYRNVHPFTGAKPGGWSWTHRSGGVPDADDTAGALLALRRLLDAGNGEQTEEERNAVAAGVHWLLQIQNSDGGWPTFCRGWGKLAFDRSTPELTAHVLRAISAWTSRSPGTPEKKAVKRGFEFLEREQRPDGSWIPLWFGNQFMEGGRNPIIGTAMVVSAYRALGLEGSVSMKRGVDFLLSAQHEDGSFGASMNGSGSAEETGLAVKALAAESLLKHPDEQAHSAVMRGTVFLMDCVESDKLSHPSPVGLYFEKLWYSEKLYPLIWTLEAFGRILTLLESSEIKPQARRGPEATEINESQ